MRVSKSEYFLQMAELVATRGTCARKTVGCVFSNNRGHVIATGYNGPAAGQRHCIDSPCLGAGFPSGLGLSKCEAIHAEQNALLQCKNVYEIDTAYITHSPCITCVKLLMNTGCKHIVFRKEYPHSESKELWLQSADGRSWTHQLV